MICPKCSHEFGGEKGGLTLVSDLNQEDSKKDQKETPKSGVRGPAREYSQAFEIAWKAYGRKEQKFESFAVWLLRAKDVGGEAKLLTLILAALKWQAFEWAPDGWKFAPYFERYLKRRKWEDEPPPQPQTFTRPDNRLAQGTDRKLTELRSHADRRATADELAALRGGRNG